MKKMTIKAIFLVIAGIVLTAGCEEENRIDIKRSRLIATENMRLKKDLEQCEREIERQKKLVEKCLQEKKASEEAIQEDVKKLAEDALKDFEEITKLREENEKLKRELEKHK
jgi:uncharacterized protein with PIN domain